MLINNTHKIIIYLCCTAVIIFILCLSNLNETFTRTNPELIYKNLKKEKEEHIYKDVVGKNIHLEPAKMTIEMPSFQEEIAIYEIEERPDIKKRDNLYELKLKSTNQKKIVNFEDKIFIDSKDGRDFYFSENETDFWIVLAKSKSDGVEVEIVSEIFTEEEEKQKISDSFFLQKEEEAAIDNQQIEAPFTELSNAKWYKEDLFLKYLKDENQGRARLELSSGIIYIQEKELLIFKDNRWQKKEEEEALNYPIAEVRTIDSRLIEMRVWDVDGKSSYSFVIPLAPDQQVNNHIEEVIAQPRMRTLHHVSCIMNKQRKMIKEKDILIKQEGRWRFIKEEELKEVPFKEIFIFDEIEKKNSQKTFKGILFNASHTEKQEIELPLQNIKRTNVVNREIKR